MTPPTLLLFDDAAARGWTPFALTRPAGELLFGTMLLRERWERWAGGACAGHLADPALSGFEEPGAPPVLALGAAPGGVRLLVSSRAVPEGRLPAGAAAPATLVLDDVIVGWLLAEGDALPDEAELLDPSRRQERGARLELDGEHLATPWALMGANEARIAKDAAAMERAPSAAPEGTWVLGDGGLFLGEGASIEPGVVLDLRHGPVVLAAGVTVQGPARLTGPLFVGEGSLVFGGHVGTSSVGRVCKVRGELEASVLNPYCNKAHDGYLGHAVTGRWVNLGALTTNSDLKNNYGPVRLRLPGGEVDTGLLKVGCFLGDHVKTGIGTLLNTGTVVGAGGNLFGGRMPPTYVPPFSWGSGDELVEYRLDKFLEVAEAAMARREVELSEGMRQVLSQAWERSAPERA